MLLFGGAISVGACWVFHNLQIEPIKSSSDSVAVRSPVKAHLLDGSTVVFRNGVTIVRDTVRGAGARYDLALRDTAMVNGVALDSIVGMESFRDYVKPAETIIVSTLTTGAVLLGSAVLAVAIFGSCPTVYADSAGTRILQAETYSYSIAPLFEARDVDRLRLTTESDGRVLLEIRNEAAETHYTNHLGLLEVRHTPDELVLPDAAGRPVVVRAPGAPAAARDRVGRDVRLVLHDADDAPFRTDPRTLAGIRAGDLEDHLDLTFARPAGTDSAALVLRLRNSLLNTVLLYDEMLAARGARALDWVGVDLERIGPAVQLGAWYAGRMGLKVAVQDGAAWRTVARLRDAGPIAWRDVAAVIPVPPGDSLRVRLSFVADNWRIDRVALAAGIRRPDPRPIAAARLLDAAGTDDTTALASVRDADQRYLQTSPGQRFSAVFEAGTVAPGEARTFLLESQGYYIEWIRPGWIATGRDTTAFQPSDAALLMALRRWRVTQDSFERRFASTRIPTR
jgi:hypothetical protein